MKTHGTILAFLIMMIFSSNSLAQFDLGEKIKKKIDKELNKAADDAIDETVDAVKKGGKDKDEEKDTKDAKTNNNSGNQTKIENPAKINTSGETLRKETSGALSFEGRVVFDVEEKGEQQKIEYYSKDKRYLMEMPEKGGSILFDSHVFKMYLIVHDEKMYMETPMMPMSAGGGAGSISKTGETKNILGYHCEKFLFTQEERKGEAWMTDELGAFMFFMDSQQEMPEWQSKLLDAGYFPLQVKEYDERRNVQSVFNVREVTPMELNSDLFVIPTSYKKIDLTNMGGLDNPFGQ